MEVLKVFAIYEALPLDGKIFGTSPVCAVSIKVFQYSFIPLDSKTVRLIKKLTINTENDMQ